MLTLNELTNKTSNELIEIIQSLKSCLENKEALISHLNETIAWMKREKFAARSEKYIDNDLQGRLFDEADGSITVATIETAEQEILIRPHLRKKTGRQPLPKDLPREQITYDLSEQEKICPCGCKLTHIGNQRTEQLDIIPAKIKVLEHVQLKYACQACHKTIRLAEKGKQPIPKSFATAGLLAYVLTQKFQFHLPLYRQEQMFKAIGVDLLRGTLSHWVIQCSQLLQPLVNLMEDEVLSYDIAYADESTVQVLNENHKTAQSKSYMWCYGGGPPGRFCYLYHYHPTREYKIPKLFFAGYRGFLHCDGYQAYDALANENLGIVLVGCWYHARRKFVDAAKISKNPGISAWFIKQIAQLTQIEKIIKNGNQTAEQAYQYRLENAKPIVENIKLKLNEQQNKAPISSLLGKAIHYLLNQWPKLQNYFKDGRLEFSNNRMERAIKPFATGRKNWLFANSVEVAKAAANVYSLIETCKAHNINPYDWLRAVLQKIPYCESVEHYEALLPFNFFKKTPYQLST
jgi:transposase